MNRFHDDGREFSLCLFHYPLQFFNLVVVERKDSAGKRVRNAFWLQPRKQMVIEAVLVLQVSRKVPVGPSVISAERDDIPSGIFASNARGNRHRFAAGARV